MVEKMGFEKNLRHENHPYGRARPETVEINGKEIYLRSQVEVRFAYALQRLKEAGAIIEWQHEPKDFWFQGVKRGTCSYRPDFHAAWADPKTGSVWYETKSKNGLKQKDVTKYKRMAKDYPDITLVLVLGGPPSTTRQKILLDNALKYVDHVSYLKDWKV